MNKLLYLLVVALLVIGGGWYYWQNSSTPSGSEVTESVDGATGTYEAGSADAGTSDTPEIPSANEVPAKVIVNITDTGFEPSVVTINKGQTVEFVNVGQKSHWPASDLHPTHEILPEFDPKKPLAPGESWSFVFVKVGKWNMHDHVRASSKGTIEVR